MSLRIQNNPEAMNALSGVETHKQARTYEGVLTYRPGGALWFANAAAMTEEVRT